MGGWPPGCSGVQGTLQPPERCFDETRYEHLEAGDRWARVSQGRVEQCECAGGQIRCEGTRHTGRPRQGAGLAGSPSDRVLKA